MSLLLLSLLPMRCAFRFRPTRAQLLPGQPERGFLQVYIYESTGLAETKHGPYAAGIGCTKADWEKEPLPFRPRPNDTDAVGKPFYNPRKDTLALLKSRIKDYNTEFVNAQAMLKNLHRSIEAPFVHELTLHLIKQKHDLAFYADYGLESPVYLRKLDSWQERTRKLIADGSQNLEMTLSEVYEEFLSVMEPLINNNQYTRTGSQISPNTYRGFVSDWHLISRWLSDQKHQELTLLALRRHHIKAFVSWASLQQSAGRLLKASYINRSLQFLGRLCKYGIDKDYIRMSPVEGVARLKTEPTEAKPLPDVFLEQMEHGELPGDLRKVALSFIVFAELCLHYADAMAFRSMKIHRFENGVRYIDHPRRKQHGTRLKITADLTPRCERILTRLGGPEGLEYDLTYNQYIYRLKLISKALGFKDEDGSEFHFQFGMARDTGATLRARRGADPRVLKGALGHSNVITQEKYVRGAQKILEDSLAGKGGGNDS